MNGQQIDNEGDVANRLVVVAGAGGFIGGHLAAELTRRGARVRAADIKPVPAWFYRNRRMQMISADLKDRDACYELFSELGFRSLTMEYAPTADTVTRDYELVTDEAALQSLVDDIRGANAFALRVLPDRPSAIRAGIVGIAVSTRPREA